MKKTLSITFLAAVLAAGTAFAGKLHSTTQWLLNDDSIVTGLASDIKGVYCAGANNVQCAIQIDKPTNLIRRP